VLQNIKYNTYLINDRKCVGSNDIFCVKTPFYFYMQCNLTNIKVRVYFLSYWRFHRFEPTLATVLIMSSLNVHSLTPCLTALKTKARHGSIIWQTDAHLATVATLRTPRTFAVSSNVTSWEMTANVVWTTAVTEHETEIKKRIEKNNVFLNLF